MTVDMDVAQHELKAQDDITEDVENSAEAFPAELSIKHPLENKWALWYFKNDRSKNWSDNLKLVAKYQFVEDFWALYNFIQPASRLPGGCDYSVFKDGIEPAWEDARNKKGGRWMINFNKAQRQDDLDPCWMEILLCLIGESFGEYSSDVCGAVVNIRGKGDKISLWTADGENEEGIRHIGRVLRDRLRIPKGVELNYFVHDDTISKSGSTARSKFKG